MANVLILFAHPALERSRFNVQLADAVRDLPGVTLHDLYERYPDFDVDVPSEQALLAAHDAVVLQHPLYWYSTPALVKQWEDLVLEHGWAYGEHGHALTGKLALHAVTTGGQPDAYTRDGFHGHTVAEFLTPLRRSVQLCRMRWLPPFVTYGALGGHEAEIERARADYCRTIEALLAERIDPARASAFEYLNQDLDAVIGPERVDAR